MKTYITFGHNEIDSLKKNGKLPAWKRALARRLASSGFGRYVEDEKMECECEAVGYLDPTLAPSGSPMGGTLWEVKIPHSATKTKY